MYDNAYEPPGNGDADNIGTALYQNEIPAQLGDGGGQAVEYAVADNTNTNNTDPEGLRLSPMYQSVDGGAGNGSGQAVEYAVV